MENGPAGLCLHILKRNFLNAKPLLPRRHKLVHEANFLVSLSSVLKRNVTLIRRAITYKKVLPRRYELFYEAYFDTIATELFLKQNLIEARSYKPQSYKLFMGFVLGYCPTT
jgi:hypothetical protein